MPYCRNRRAPSSLWYAREGRPHFAFNQPAGKQHGEPMEFDTIHCHLLSLNKVVHKARQQC